MNTNEQIAVEILNEIREQGDEVESYYLGKLIPKIKQIRLDAYRKGGLDAARMAQLTQDRPHDATDVNYRSGLHWMRQRIEMNLTTHFTNSNLEIPK